MKLSMNKAFTRAANGFNVDKIKQALDWADSEAVNGARFIAETAGLNKLSEGNFMDAMGSTLNRVFGFDVAQEQELKPIPVRSHRPDNF